MSRQIIELIKKLRADAPTQNIKRQVPEFQDWRCHGKGMRTITNDRKAQIGKRGYVGSNMVCAQRRRGERTE